jgi:hypothetical protein
MNATMQGPSATPVRIAMWSGPRNISTAMMRSFGARSDTAVCDEPLYACYLAATGAPHPGAQEVIASQPTDWREVVRYLTGPVPDGRPVWYQKHMSHHLLPQIERTWIRGLRNAFLIRSPKAMLASLARVIDRPQLEDTGLAQQVELYDWLRGQGQTPPVVDGEDILTDPDRMLARLCEALALPFARDMLSWAPGPRPTDGVWARHWYDSVANSSGFTPYRPREVELPPVVAPLLEPCQALYDRLYEVRLR